MKRRYLIAIGLMVIVALGLVTRALIFLHPTPGDGAQHLKVRFQNVDKISPGTRVTFAGKPVGEVKRIDLLPEAFHRTETTKKIFPYELLLAIDSSVTIYKSDEISVRTAGLMGERFIAINPRPPSHEGEMQPVAGEVIYAAQSGSVEETFGEITTVAHKADLTMEALTQLIQKNQDGLCQATQAIQEASTQLATFLKTLNDSQFGERTVHLVNQISTFASKIEQENIISSLGEAAAHLKRVTEQLDQPETLAACMENANKGLCSFSQASSSFNETALTIKKASEEISTIAKELLPVVTATGHGESSLGKLMKDPRLYDTFLSVSTLTSQLMKDIDTYGIMFHLNKDWQRERYLREQNLGDLPLPVLAKQEFADVASSINSLNIKLSNAHQTLGKGSLAEDEELRNQFSSGLKQVQDEIDHLQEALKQLDMTPDYKSPAGE